MTHRRLFAADVLRLAEQSARVTEPCDCAKRSYPGWESQYSSFPDEQLECVGQVAGAEMDGDGDLTVQEYHPAGTSYASPDAPLALHWFPFNRSEIWQCRQCGRAFARYTEYGGYYIDRRIRSLRPELITSVVGPVVDP